MAYITLANLTLVISANRPDLDAAVENLTDEQITFAANVLDSIDWVGVRVSSTQDHAWPRANVPIDRFNISLGYMDSSTIPTEILLILGELAIRYSLNPGITSDSASGIAVTGVSLPDSRFDLIGDYIRSRIRAFLSNSSRAVRVGG